MFVTQEINNEIATQKYLDAKGFDRASYAEFMRQRYKFYIKENSHLRGELDDIMAKRIDEVLCCIFFLILIPLRVCVCMCLRACMYA